MYWHLTDKNISQPESSVLKFSHPKVLTVKGNSDLRLTWQIVKEKTAIKNINSDRNLWNSPYLMVNVVYTILLIDTLSLIISH